MIDLSGQWLTWIGSWHLSAWDKEVSGYVASSLVLFTFCMRSMRSLRVIALASNVAFIFFAAVSDIAPVLVLHTILLPVNATRLVQIQLARAEAKRLLVRDSPYMPGAELGSPRFLSAGTLADPASALPLVEREQERVAGLLVANLPSEAATASGNELAVAAPAARKLLTEIEKFLVSLMASRPSADLLQWIAGLHSRNNVLSALHETLGELAPLIRQAAANGTGGLAEVIGEGLGVLLIHADEAALSREAEKVDLLLATTGDRSSLVEQLRQAAITRAVAGDSTELRAVYDLTSLYERTVWLLHRYAMLLANGAGS